MAAFHVKRPTERGLLISNALRLFLSRPLMYYPAPACVFGSKSMQTCSLFTPNPRVVSESRARFCAPASHEQA